MTHCATCTCDDGVEGYRTRRDDHATSEKGAQDVTWRAGSQKVKLLRAWYDAEEHGLTNYQAACETGLLRACYWKRADEIRDLGLIAWMPGVERLNFDTNSMQQASVITPAGIRRFEDDHL